MSLNVDSEEFSNFLVKVDEVSGIVKNLTSNDKEKNKLGTLQADEYLKGRGDVESVILDENTTVVTRTKYNRSLINKKAFFGHDNPAEMSQENFMRSVEVDAERRSKDRARRKEQSDTFKKRANTAFRQGEYEKALSYYNEALSHIKDNCVLYTNRALTYINMRLYDRAIDDCKMALKLDSDSLKAWLYLVKCYLYTKDKLFEEAIKQVKSRHPTQMDYIDDYVIEVKKNAGWNGVTAHHGSDRQGPSNSSRAPDKGNTATAIKEEEEDDD